MREKQEAKNIKNNENFQMREKQEKQQAENFKNQQIQQQVCNTFNDEIQNFKSSGKLTNQANRKIFRIKNQCEKQQQQLQQIQENEYPQKQQKNYLEFSNQSATNLLFAFSCFGLIRR
eukprot:TRINITY_DN4882_c0_g2_i8.p4 TRINITY_DN4882_c0_g2~~TRINITY_DN4882_c0_g2_i8.p4  ORF type:complete len:118 (+),score=17.64 TRINITY_DN4882_c0_g2_i8:818-1171(+)